MRRHQYTEHEKKDLRSIVFILSALVIASIVFLAFITSQRIPTGGEVSSELE